jgi:purine-cytosine permease-like protein
MASFIDYLLGFLYILAIVLVPTAIITLITYLIRRNHIEDKKRFIVKTFFIAIAIVIVIMIIGMIIGYNRKAYF